MVTQCEEKEEEEEQEEVAIIASKRMGTDGCKTTKFHCFAEPAEYLKFF